MNDPYSVLGVSPDDSEDTVKKAYRTKAFEIESSNMSQSEKQSKMAELDSAFDYIFNQKRGTGNTGSSSSQSSYSTQFPDVRRQIAEGRIDDAETILDGIPENMRSAEWHYLKGLIYRSRGWLNEAYSYFGTAVSLDPENEEYKEAYQSMSKKANGGYKLNNNDRSGCGGCCSSCDCFDCDECLSDICAFVCCECLCEALCEGC